MFLIRKCFFCGNSSRGFSTVTRNFYESLGVKQDATIAEIKSAYYALSKIHHPDANAGSEASILRFREITAAYEVIGNVKSRKLYDKGLIVGDSGTTLRRDDIPPDPVSTFYQKREKRDRVPVSPSGETIYDFDAWTRAHYSDARERKQEDRSRMMKKTRKNEMAMVIGTERTMAAILALMICVMLAVSMESFNSYDVDRTEKRDRKKVVTSTL